ncbi:hypothetical protein [Streptomyces sp. Tu 3180]|uniref:hypothetical protein n=1 Tax=Streptomyces sp. Tu 3180 TaxID=2682611 RepID=UPI00135BF01A|nr:hypothetical protein [Streptomyces sp. Tu 3180]KAF3463944.1 hypothetical protein GL259_06275 [Streptomyces sp. Tu 3180]
MGSGELVELNRAFKHRLSYPSPRRTGGVDGVGPVDPAAPAALREVDVEQLARVSHELTQGIAQGAIGGVPLREHFEHSLRALYPDRHNAGQRAVAEFLRGHHCSDVDMLGLRRGRSVTEAFGEFLLDRAGRGTDTALLVERELLASLVKTLARHPEPGFLIRHPHLRRTGERSWAAWTDGVRLLRDPDREPTAPTVFVACGGRYFTGGLSVPLVAALLWGTEPRPGWLRAWTAGERAERVGRARAVLRGKGLVP